MMGKIEKIKLFLLGLIVLATSANLFATEYFVTNTTEFSALTLNSGDVVILKNGVWENAKLEFTGTGTESMPITLKAETGGEVFFTGNSNIEIGGEYLIVDGLVFKEGYTTRGHVIAFRSS